MPDELTPQLREKIVGRIRELHPDAKSRIDIYPCGEGFLAIYRSNDGPNNMVLDRYGKEESNQK